MEEFMEIFNAFLFGMGCVLLPFLGTALFALLMMGLRWLLNRLSDWLLFL